MKRKRNPRRLIVDVRTECIPYGQAMVSVHYCVLECGHKVEGYPDTRDGRKACPECGREARDENARLREALRLAEGPIAIAASYADQPCETMGMRVHAKDCARILPKIHAALAGEGEAKPGRTLDRHGADRGRWVGVWDAINRYSEACGGSPTAGGPSRMKAVVEVERALDAVLAGEEEAKRCTWTYDETHCAWDSSCGEKLILEDGGPNENRIRFCHGCGKPVEVV